MTQQLCWLLSPQQFTWPDSPNDPVLARVASIPANPDFFSLDAAAPFALVHPEATRGNPEHPADLVEEARWSVYLFAANATDQAGGAALVGGNRQSLGQSYGRGVLEVSPVVQAKLWNALGLTARPRAGGTQAPGVSGKLPGLVADLALDVVATRFPQLPDFAPVTKFKTIFAGPPAALVWAPLASRYDLIGYTWRRAAGSTAPSTPTGGSAGGFVAGSGRAASTITVVDTTFFSGCGFTFYVSGGAGSYSVSGTFQATPALAAAQLAADINATSGLNGFVTATASGAVVTVLATTSLYLLTVQTGAGSSTAVTVNESGLVNNQGAGTFSYSIFWAYDATRDPSLSIGESTPNRWSSQQTAQNGLVYLPASVTV